MIENLEGIHETVNYKPDTNVRLYNNDWIEDFPEHWHTPLEIIMPLENMYTITIGKNDIELKTDDILFIFPGVIHAIKSPISGSRMIFQADLSMLRQMKELDALFAFLSPAITITAHNAPLIHSKIKELLLEIKQEYNTGGSMTEASIYAKIISIFALIGRDQNDKLDRFDAGNQKQKEYADKFSAICEYIADHCTEDLTLDFIAKKAGFSKYHFTRLFHQFTNITFYKYLNQKRVAFAQELLLNPELSVTEVALQCGFSNLSSFIRMFKMIKFCTPTEFRNMYTK